MRVLGIDCGSRCTGYGVIESDGRRHQLLTAGAIEPAHKPLASRLESIYVGLRRIVEEYAPDGVAVEEVFYATNAQSALKLAHVRGVALLVAAQANLEVGEYSALEIKGSVVGYGRAAKSQVQLMVSSLLHLPHPVQSQDAADALAVAICHATRVVVSRKTMAFSKVVGG